MANWFFKLVGSVTGNVAEVDANNALKIVPALTPSIAAGFMALAGKNDDGTIVAVGRVNRMYVSEGQGGKVAIPDLLWDDTFNSLAQNTAKYKYLSSATITSAQAGGFLVLNSGLSVAININAALQTWKSFPIFAKSELRVNVSAVFTQVPQANETYEWGLFQATLPGAAIPLDGVFYRRNSSGELRGVVNYNGTETTTPAIAPPSVNVNHDYVIVVQTNTVLFYIDDILRGMITLVTDAPTQGQPMMAASVPLTIRYYIGGSAPGIASQMKVSDVFITSLGPDLVRSFAELKAGFGHMASQGQNGGTMGTTGQNANNSNPAATVPTNTTAALGVGLGGKFQETLTLAAGTDGIIQSFQNPAGGVNQTPRNLVIRGVTVNAVVTVALTVAPLTGVLSLCYGHTALSLATAELGSFVTGTTKAPRKIAIGAVGAGSAAAIGSIPTGVPLVVKFDSPIVVAPGEFVAIAHCKATAAPTTGAIMWTIAFDAYYE